MSEVLLEVCVDSADGLLAALKGGADRIELCSALELGGLTPSAGLMRMAAQVPLPVYGMIRPRGGDFVYSRAELDVMRRDIDAVHCAGLAGVVIGASRPGGALDIRLLEELSAAADGLGLTLHRAFDLVPDISEAVEQACSLGVERILTSGGQPSAVLGIGRIQDTLQAAAGRVSIMPGSGISAANVRSLLEVAVCQEVHSSCSEPGRAVDSAALALGFGCIPRRQTSEHEVKAIKRVLSDLVGHRTPSGTNC